MTNLDRAGQASGDAVVIDITAAEKMYGRRGYTQARHRVHAIRNDATGPAVTAYCGARIGGMVGQDRGVTCPRCRHLLAAAAKRLSAPYAERIATAEDAIRAAGFRLRYVDACEGDGAAGIIGMGVGVTMWDRREVRIRNMLTGVHLAEVLEHELAHVQELPGFECGTHSYTGKGAT